MTPTPRPDKEKRHIRATLVPMFPIAAFIVRLMLVGALGCISYAKARMTPAQIVEAERMATEWKSSHPER